MVAVAKEEHPLARERRVHALLRRGRHRLIPQARDVEAAHAREVGTEAERRRQRHEPDGPKERRRERRVLVARPVVEGVAADGGVHVHAALVEADDEAAVQQRPGVACRLLDQGGAALEQEGGEVDELRDPRGPSLGNRRDDRSARAVPDQDDRCRQRVEDREHAVHLRLQGHVARRGGVDAARGEVEHRHALAHALERRRDLEPAPGAVPRPVDQDEVRGRAAPAREPERGRGLDRRGARTDGRHGGELQELTTRAGFVVHGGLPRTVFARGPLRPSSRERRVALAHAPAGFANRCV